MPGVSLPIACSQSDPRLFRWASVGAVGIQNWVSGVGNSKPAGITPTTRRGRSFIIDCLPDRVVASAEAALPQAVREHDDVVGTGLVFRGGEGAP